MSTGHYHDPLGKYDYCDDPKCPRAAGPAPEPYSVTEFVVEYQLVHGASDWVRFPADLSSSDKDTATKGYESLVASKRSRGSGRVHYRVVKRTAVITDEVILEDTEESEEA